MPPRAKRPARTDPRRTPLERDIVHDIRVRLGREPDLVLWRNSAGFDSEHGQRYGLITGASDLLGILSPHGRWFALEVKRPASPGKRGGKLTDEQERFLELIRSRGGFADWVESVEDAILALNEARAGRSCIR